MNQLSWFLYWAGVAPNLAGLAIFIGIIVIILSAIMLSIICGLHCDKHGDNAPRWVWPLPFLGVLLTFCLWGGAALVPPTETFYAIAASQVGEAAMKTPLAGKAGEALSAWLDKQIKDAKAPEPSKGTP